MANSPSGLNADPRHNMTLSQLREIKTLQSVPDSAVFINVTNKRYIGEFYAITATGVVGCTLGFDDGTAANNCTVANTSAYSKFDDDLKLSSGTTIFIPFSKVRITAGECIAYAKTGGITEEATT